ncbi:unnamed protein product, partial [Mesorhabditis spiculigera]
MFDLAAIPGNADDPGKSTRFWGPMTQKSVRNQLEPGDFAFFYPLPDDDESEGPPLAVLLNCAYLSSKNRFHVFPVSSGRQGWRVEIGERLMPVFSTLSQLIRHHEIHSYLCLETRVLENFPVFASSRGSAEVTNPVSSSDSSSLSDTRPSKKNH